MVGVATADGVDTVAEGVDPPHEEEREANAMPSRAAISGEPNQRFVVTVRTGHSPPSDPFGSLDATP